MKKSRKTNIIMAVMMLIITTILPTTAMAGGDITDEQIQPTYPTYEQPTEPLTPDGNLTLIDDIEGDQTQTKQFITLQSKNGNYFYLIIDRDGDKENVYFLNLVDEADLMALVEDDAIPLDPESTPTPQPEEEQEPQPELDPTPQPEQEESSPAAGVAIALILAGVAGGAFYYFKVLRPKQDSALLSEYDDYDDDYDDYNPDDYTDQDGEMEYMFGEGITEENTRGVQGDCT